MSEQKVKGLDRRISKFQDSSVDQFERNVHDALLERDRKLVELEKRIKELEAAP
jgi:hypothetical protein